MLSRTHLHCGEMHSDLFEGCKSKIFIFCFFFVIGSGHAQAHSLANNNFKPMNRFSTMQFQPMSTNEHIFQRNQLSLWNQLASRKSISTISIFHFRKVIVGRNLLEHVVVVRNWRRSQTRPNKRQSCSEP